MKEIIKLDDLQPALQRVFDSRDGKLVMNWLEQQFYDCRIYGGRNGVFKQVGERNVVLKIKQLMTREGK